MLALQVVIAARNGSPPLRGWAIFASLGYQTRLSPDALAEKLPAYFKT